LDVCLCLYSTNISFQIEEFTILPFSPTTQASTAIPSLQSYYITGREINSHQDFLDSIKSLIWFTYRKNAEIAPQTYSDVGWGCLLRVTQMAFANALLRYSEANEGLNRLGIIRACIEERDSEYGIGSFILAGQEHWSRNVGDWYSMTEAAMVLQTLHEQTPLQGSELLKVAVYN
jgi:hypothetical protein